MIHWSTWIRSVHSNDTEFVETASAGFDRIMHIELKEATTGKKSIRVFASRVTDVWWPARTTVD